MDTHAVPSIPQLGGRVMASSCDPVADCRDGEGANEPVVSCKDVLATPRLEIPQSSRAIVARSRKPGSIRPNRNGLNGAIVSCQSSYQRRMGLVRQRPRAYQAGMPKIREVAFQYRSQFGNTFNTACYHGSKRMGWIDGPKQM
jgi:hypothetical protein